jgi:hypothetical protein
MRLSTANLFLSCAIFIVSAGSCKKTNKSPEPPPASTRTIRYILYTTQDFSDDHDSIFFRVQIFGPARTIFDSAIAPMLISQIPAKAQSIVIDKLVPAGFEKDSLLVGFDYKIKDVGESWHREPCGPSTTLKQMEFDFH